MNTTQVKDGLILLAIAGAAVLVFVAVRKIDNLGDGLGKAWQSVRESASNAMDSAGLYLDQKKAVENMYGESMPLPSVENPFGLPSAIYGHEGKNYPAYDEPWNVQPIFGDISSVPAA